MSASAAAASMDLDPDICRVVGCGAELRSARKFFRRYQVCQQHAKASAVVLIDGDGTEQRFCQQCCQFHDLSSFDGERRSCRERLALHNGRRRKLTHFDVASVVQDPGASADDARDSATTVTTSGAGPPTELLVPRLGSAPEGNTIDATAAAAAAASIDGSGTRSRLRLRRSVSDRSHNSSPTTERQPQLPGRLQPPGIEAGLMFAAPAADVAAFEMGPRRQIGSSGSARFAGSVRFEGSGEHRRHLAPMRSSPDVMPSSGTQLRHGGCYFPDMHSFQTSRVDSFGSGTKRSAIDPLPAWYGPTGSGVSSIQLAPTQLFPAAAEADADNVRMQKYRRSVSMGDPASGRALNAEQAAAVPPPSLSLPPTPLSTDGAPTAFTFGGADREPATAFTGSDRSLMLDPAFLQAASQQQSARLRSVSAGTLPGDGPPSQHHTAAADWNLQRAASADTVHHHGGTAGGGGTSGHTITSGDVSGWDPSGWELHGPFVGAPAIGNLQQRQQQQQQQQWAPSVTQQGYLLAGASSGPLTGLLENAHSEVGRQQYLEPLPPLSAVAASSVTASAAQLTASALLADDSFDNILAHLPLPKSMSLMPGELPAMDIAQQPASMAGEQPAMYSGQQQQQQPLSQAHLTRHPGSVFGLQPPREQQTWLQQPLFAAGRDPAMGVRDWQQSVPQVMQWPLQLEPLPPRPSSAPLIGQPDLSDMPATPGVPAPASQGTVAHNGSNSGHHPQRNL